MRRFYFLISCLIVLLCGCSPSTPVRKVGVDPSWYPLNFQGRSNNVTTFSTELLTKIGKIEKIPFVKVTVNWDVLLEGLNKGQYEAILTSMPPYIFNQKNYNYSDIYLPLGPVLVVPISSNIHSLDQLEEKEVGIVQGASGITLLEQAPGVLIRSYESTPRLLNALADGNLDGAMVDILTATAYCNDLYQGKLKVATPPLNDEGLRLITKKEQGLDLIKRFNAGLKKLKKNGSYNQMLKKWNLEES